METQAASAGLKRLYKSRRDKIIDGVCGGIAEYFNVDATIIRILFVAMAFLGGAGVILYLVGMVLMPANPEHLASGAVSAGREKNLTLVWGSILVVLGVVLLLSNLGLFAFYRVWEMSWGIVFAAALILLGLAIISRERRIVSSGSTEAAAPQSGAAAEVPGPELKRSRTNRKFFGVCGGLGSYFRVDPTVARILFVVVGLASFGLALLVYLLLAILMPKEEIQQQTVS